MKRTIQILCAAAMIAATQPALAADTANPERSATKRVANWHFTSLSASAINEKARDLGARVIDLEVVSTSPMRYAATFVKNGAPHSGKWWWYGNLTADQVNARTREKDARLIDVEVFRRNGALRFAVVMKKNTGSNQAGWYWFYDQTPASLNEKTDRLGMRLIDVERYQVNGRSRFAAVMTRNTGAHASGWYWYQGRTRAQLADKLAQHNMRPIDIDRHRINGRTVYDVVMMPYETGAQGTWYYHGIPSADVAIMARRHGARIVDIERVGNNRYNVIYLNNGMTKNGDCRGRLSGFGNAVERLMTQNAIPGAQVAVARGDRLVYSCALGFGDLEAADKTTPSDLFRVMSVSKLITASAIRHLEADGAFSRSDTMISALGNRAPSGPYADSDMTDVTVQELLSHRSGFDRNAPYDPMVSQTSVANDMNDNAPLRCREITDFTIKNHPLAPRPLSDSLYSNLGYCILQQIVAEHGTGTYQQFVKNTILAPAGITAMRIGKGRFVDRAPGEVRYYDRPFQPKRASQYSNVANDVPRPYSYVVEAMAGHGGWLASANDLVRYAAFTPTRPGGSSRIWHSGSLNGTKSILMERNGTYVAVIMNGTPTNPAEDFDRWTWIAPLVDSISEWPTRNLWDKYGYPQN